MTLVDWSGSPMPESDAASTWLDSLGECEVEILGFGEATGEAYWWSIWGEVVLLLKLFDIMYHEKDEEMRIEVETILVLRKPLAKGNSFSLNATCLEI